MGDREAARSPCDRAGHPGRVRARSMPAAAPRRSFTGLRVGVAAHLVRLGLGQRGFRDQRIATGVLGLAHQDRALLVGDGQLGAQALESVAHVDEPAFQQGLGHGNHQSTARPGVAALTAMMRHPIFTAEHEELRGTVRRFVDAEVRPHVVEWEDAGHFPDDLFRRCGELGFPRPPPEHGGAAAAGDLATGLVFVGGARPVRRGRDPDGHLGADPHGHARARRVRHRRPARALAAPGDRGHEDRRDRDHRARRRLRRRRDPHPRGARRRRLARQRAQDVHHQRHARALPHARRQDRSRRRATTACRSSSSTRRCRACPCRRLEKLGMHSSDTAEIALDDVAVPAHGLVGLEPGRGFAQLMWQLQYERLAGAAASVGHADRKLDDTIACARAPDASANRSHNTR